MLSGFRFQSQFHPILNQRYNLHQTLTLEMSSPNPNPPKRPICPACSKPIRLCLCSRFKSPLFDNSISLTILQHNQEKNHPLNSTRIATLGLKNLTLATVSDVHFEAKFFISLLKSYGLKNGFLGQSEEPHLRKPAEVGSSMSNGGGHSDTHLKVLGNNEKMLGFEDVKMCPEEKVSDLSTTNGQFPEKDTNGSIEVLEVEDENRSHESAYAEMDMPRERLLDATEIKEMGDEEEEGPVITATIEKLGFTCALTKLRTRENGSRKLDFDQLLNTKVGHEVISEGFVVKKLHKKKVKGSVELEESEEFEIVIPPGSALLFPTKKSIGVEDVGFEVKHLIVLDGTWAKAKRMYHENPWLKLLPHLKLDPDKMSLYSEVRHQPQEGCLSTIESVVYALRGLGDDGEELDNLLEVFESMVWDQRRCKDERLSQISPL